MAELASVEVEDKEGKSEDEVEEEKKKIEEEKKGVEAKLRNVSSLTEFQEERLIDLRFSESNRLVWLPRVHPQLH